MTGEEMFKNPNLTLNELAKAVNLTSHQLSQVLNDDLGKNFTSYVNEYRINEACRMMTKEHPFSLEAIGYEVGFNSKSTFYSAFKKLKSTTPLLYKAALTKSDQVANASLSVK
jgi:AraC-like DNA-binding protein